MAKGCTDLYKTVQDVVKTLSLGPLFEDRGELPAAGASHASVSTDSANIFLGLATSMAPLSWKQRSSLLSSLLWMSLRCPQSLRGARSRPEQRAPRSSRYTEHLATFQ